MDTRLLVFAIAIGLSILLLGIGILLFMIDRHRARVRRRIEELEIGLEIDEPDLLRDDRLSSVPWLDAILRRLHVSRQLERMLMQADLQIQVGGFLLLIFVLAAVGVLGSLTLAPTMPWLAAPVAFILALIPVITVHRMRVKRMMMFERQFPDALDLMTGALRSGMAFTGALQVVSEESPDPVAKEFAIVFEEHRLGLGLRECFRNMMRRMDSQELRLFVTAVLLQHDMGGNLAEILEGTAAVIRDRFRILGDVRTITAQARLSGFILTVLPMVMAVIIMFMAPDYLKTLVEDPIGPYMIVLAIALQIIGYLVIRRIINIKV
jgi:tight adherence protein B